MKPVSSLKYWWGKLLTPKSSAILDACLIGLTCGLAAALLKLAVGWLRLWRVELALKYPPWLFLPLLGLVGGVLAGWLVNRFAPETAGSGVPQVKAALSGVFIPLNGRTALVKLLSNAIALGSGLTLGRQGPTVYIGAALAAQLSQWIPTSPDYRRQMIAAGAAAGLASGFNAPISGVMFAVEELLHDVSGFTLGPTLLASFIGAVVSRLWGEPSLAVNLNLASSQTSFSVREIPFYLLLGILAGVLGVLFAKGILASVTFNQNVLRLPLPWRVGLAGLICGLTISIFRSEFRTHISLRELLIAGGTDARTIAIALMVYFSLTIIAAGSGAPGGLFAPSLIIGAALGDLVGFGQVHLLGVGTPTTYALTGMGALFCVIYKAPITAVIIIFEITRDFNLVLPLMISSAVAYLVSETIDSGSLYDRLQEMNGILLQKELIQSDPLHTLRVAHVMPHRPLETLKVSQTINEAVKAFARSRRHAMPVLDGELLVGVVTQTDLLKLYQQLDDGNGSSYTGKTLVQEIMTTQPVTIGSMETLNDVLYKLEKHNLSRLPVTDEGKLVGMISISDIIRAETNFLSTQRS